MYLTQEQYETLKSTIKKRSEESKIWCEGKRKAKHKKKHTVLSFEECENYCEYYLSNNMKELKFIVSKILGKMEDEKTYFDEREKYELKDLGYEVFVLSLGTYDPETKCSFKTFLYGNIKRKFSTYGRDRTRTSRCNWEPKWDDENKCYKLNKDGEIEMRPVFDVSMYSKSNENSKNEGRELWETFKSKGDFVKRIVESETENNIESYSPAMQNYLNTLSSVQMEVLRLISEGFKKEEILEILHIPPALYTDSIAAIKNPKNTRLLRRSE